MHGGSGPVPITRTQPEDYQPLARAFAAAFAELGFRAEPDKNGEQPPGYGPVPRNAVDGVRINTGIAYINPHRQRPNLTIRGNTFARKVVFDGTRATGLEVETDGQVETIEAGQIVLSAGAFNSPHLLLLSGIGPAAELTAASVPVIEDLPGVGKDFSDHPDIFVTWVARHKPHPHRLHTQFENVLNWTANDSPYPGGDLEILPFLQSFGTLLLIGGGSPIATILGQALHPVTFIESLKGSPSAVFSGSWSPRARCSSRRRCSRKIRAVRSRWCPATPGPRSRSTTTTCPPATICAGCGRSSAPARGSCRRRR